MALDNKDEKEVKEVKAASDLPKPAHRESVINETSNQDRWRKMDEAHQLKQDESATDIFRPKDERGKGSNRLTIGGLDEAADSSRLVAYNLKDAERDWNNAGKKIDTFVKTTKSQAEHPELIRLEAPHSLDVAHPHRGAEADSISDGACKAASRRFPELSKRLGPNHGQIDPDLIAGVIWHEQESYKQLYDTGVDAAIRKTGRADGTDEMTSIGPAQIQLRSIHRLITEFSWQLGHYANDPLRAAIRPGDAPYFVAGYFASVIKNIETGTRPAYIGALDWADVRKKWDSGDLNGALIHSYNPNPRQVQYVMDSIKQIRKNRPE